MTLPPHDLGVRAVLQAGGRGQRMGSGDTPKPMRAVGGVPMVERLLRQLVGAGIRDVTVVTGWLGDVVERHVEGLVSDLDGVAVDYLRERTPLGNAGALGLVPRSAPAVLVFADLVTEIDFAELVRVHRERGAVVTLASHEEQVRVRLGEIVADGDRVRAYLEKPLKTFLICSGVAVFEPEVLALAADDPPVGLSDLVTRALGAGHEVTHWAHGAAWADVNTPDELASVSPAGPADD